MDKEMQGIEINLSKVIHKFLENIKYIVLAAFLFGLLGYIGSTYFITPIYEANAKLIVNSRNDESQNITNDQLNSSKNLAGTYAVVLRSRDVLNRVSDELGLEESYSQLANIITVSSVNDTPILQIRVRHSDWDTAFLIAAKILEIAPEVLQDTTEAGSVKPVEQVYANPNPISPNVMNNTFFAAFLGVALTCFVIIIVLLLDRTYKSDLDIHKDLGLPVLGVIPAVESCVGYIRQKNAEKGEKQDNV